MLMVADVIPSRRWEMTEQERTLWGIEKLNVPRSEVPAIAHVDYSARIQTVRRDVAPLYWEIIEAFRQKTGCPVIVNTSFNVRGEPIVCAPEDAYRMLHAHEDGRVGARGLRAGQGGSAAVRR